MATLEYAVTGMTCSHCESSVREEVSQIPGVQVVDVDAATGRLVIESQDAVDDAAVIAAVDEAGYAATARP